MATIEKITTDVNSAKLYYINKLGEELVKIQGGYDRNLKSLSALKRLIKGLTFQINRNLVDDNTNALYKCLLTAIGGFTGNYQVDPNVIIPGIQIVFIPPYLEPIDIHWEDLSPTYTTDAGLGRTLYYNPLWKGVNPLMQVGNTAILFIGVDYDIIASGGFKLRSGGNIPSLYEGQVIRVYNYQLSPVSPIPDPPLLTPKLTALTSLSGSFTPAFASNTLAYTDAVSAPNYKVTPIADLDEAVITVNVNGTNSQIVASGVQSGNLPLTSGVNTINIYVASGDGERITHYTIVVTYTPVVYDTTYTLLNSATVYGTIPANGATAQPSTGYTGSEVKFKFNHQPVTGGYVAVEMDLGFTDEFGFETEAVIYYYGIAGNPWEYTDKNNIVHIGVFQPGQVTLT